MNAPTAPETPEARADRLQRELDTLKHARTFEALTQALQLQRNLAAPKSGVRIRVDDPKDSMSALELRASTYHLLVTPDGVVFIATDQSKASPVVFYGPPSGEVLPPDVLAGLAHVHDTTPDGPREWTAHEMRTRLLEAIAIRLEWWLKETRTPDSAGKLEGLVHSILAILDGSAMSIPGFQLVPTPHENDAGFHRANGENWWSDQTDIGGALAAEWSMFRRRTR